MIRRIKDLYYHIAWSDYPDGTELTLEEPEEGALYVGTYVSATDSTENDNPSKYKWELLENDNDVDPEEESDFDIEDDEDEDEFDDYIEELSGQIEELEAQTEESLSYSTDGITNENLLSNTNNGASGWSGNVDVLSDNVFDDSIRENITRINVSNGSTVRFYAERLGLLSEEGTYTLSLDYRASNTMTVDVKLTDGTVSAIDFGTFSTEAVGDEEDNAGAWEHAELTEDGTSAIENAYLLFTFSGSGTLDIFNLKVESGARATPWVMSAGEAAKVATDYITDSAKVEGAIFVHKKGDLDNGVYIDNDSVDIVKDGEEVASFGEMTILKTATSETEISSRGIRLYQYDPDTGEKKISFKADKNEDATKHTMDLIEYVKGTSEEPITTNSNKYSFEIPLDNAFRSKSAGIWVYIITPSNKYHAIGFNDRYMDLKGAPEGVCNTTLIEADGRPIGKIIYKWSISNAVLTFSITINYLETVGGGVPEKFNIATAMLQWREADYACEFDGENLEKITDGEISALSDNLSMPESVRLYDIINYIGKQMPSAKKVSKDNVTCETDSVATIEISAKKTGLTPIGIVGIKISNASSNGSGASFVTLRDMHIENNKAIVRVYNRRNAQSKIKVELYLLYTGVQPNNSLIEQYSGTYTVTPSVVNAQTLETANKKMAENVTVKTVPFFETTSTETGGTTIYIGEQEDE